MVEKRINKGNDWKAKENVRFNQYHLKTFYQNIINKANLIRHQDWYLLDMTSSAALVTKITTDHRTKLVS